MIPFNNLRLRNPGVREVGLHGLNQRIGLTKSRRAKKDEKDMEFDTQVSST